MIVLVLGGTGAMGTPLVRLLAEKHVVHVTSRRSHPSSGNIQYLQGNAHDFTFLDTVLSARHYDAIVDFMVWDHEFKEALPRFLSHTDQYVYISSARVYAQSDNPITEETPRLLDVSDDDVYLNTNEYALAKAREEDLIRSYGRKNYTIIRPSITYNKYRLQLGVLEKEAWLYRALHHRSIVFSEDIADKLTAMTHGDDVAKGINAIIGKREAFGEVLHITHPKSVKWSVVLSVYLQVLEQHLGKKVRVVMTEKSLNFNFPNRIYQIIYCRYFNRTFDNSRINRYIDTTHFTSPDEGLSACLQSFLKEPKFDSIDWQLEAYNDRAAGEHTPLSEIPKLRQKVYYVAIRYNMKWMIKPMEWLTSLIHTIKRITH